MENVKCAICDSLRSKELLSAKDPDMICEESYRVVKCDNCGLVFTNPRPKQEELSKFYAQQYYGRLKVYLFNFIEKTLVFFQQLRLRKIKKIVRCGRVLDIGCGKGMFLKSLSRAGFDVYGVEPSQANQPDFSPQELNIASRDLCDLRYPDSYFDIITLWHVLEHISNPKGILREIKRIIKAKGTLIMAIPNFESLEAKLSHKNWFHLDLPRHLYHYNPVTLENMLKIEGFKIFKIEYFSLEFGPFGLFQTLMNMLGGEFNFLAKILKGNNINKFQSNKRCYSLGLFLFLMPFLPLIILFSLVEACCKKGAILTVYAKAVK